MTSHSRVLLSEPSSTGVRQLWLERADKANALDPALVDALAAAIEQIAIDPPRVLAIEGRGRNFCAGFDFTGYEALSDAELLWRFVAIEQMLARLRALPCVTVACVRGGAFGAGADLAAACTFRLGLPGARFRFPGFQFGLALGTRALAALIGQQAAREILLSGAVVDGARALQIGLLSTLLDETLDAQASAETSVDGAREASAGTGGFAAQVEAINSRFGGLDAASAALALANTRPQTADADLADLVRSVTRPGLKARIAAYRQGG